MQALTERRCELSDWRGTLIAERVSPSRRGRATGKKDMAEKSTGSSGNELRYSEGRNSYAVLAAFLCCDKGKCLPVPF
jgi:hypothetical protein